MPEFHFYHPIEVRYGDLDPQGHVNNAKYLTYFEQARGYYLVELGLFSMEQSFMDIGVIIADIHITYHAPVMWGTPIQVGVRTARLGTKSATIEQCVTDAADGKMYATGTVILVAYDYHNHQTIPVPDEWREKITTFERLND
jgi:acyl-CoA thioester hydrolase